MHLHLIFVSFVWRCEVLSFFFFFLISVHFWNKCYIKTRELVLQLHCLHIKPAHLAFKQHSRRMVHSHQIYSSSCSSAWYAFCDKNLIYTMARFRPFPIFVMFFASYLFASADELMGCFMLTFCFCPVQSLIAGLQ